MLNTSLSYKVLKKWETTKKPLLFLYEDKEIPTEFCKLQVLGWSKFWSASGLSSLRCYCS